MEFRNLGASGLKISAIAYGNWLTHGSQVEEEAALEARLGAPNRDVNETVKPACPSTERECTHH